VRLVHQPVQTAGAIEQRILGVQVQMYKFGVRHGATLRQFNNLPQDGNEEDVFSAGDAVDSLRLEESLDDGGHPLNLRVGQLGINRQAQALTRGLFRRREIAGFVAEVGIALLHVQ